MTPLVRQPPPARPPRRVRLVDRGAALQKARELSKAVGADPPGTGALERAVVAAVQALQRAFDAAGFDSIANAITAGNVIRALDMDALANTIGRAANQSLGTVSKARAREAVGKFLSADRAKLLSSADRAVFDQALQLTLAGLDQRAVDWAETQSGTLIKQISDDVLAGIRQTMAGAMRGEYDVRAAAAIIRQSIGLTTTQAGWVAKRYSNAVDGAIKAGSTRDQAVAIANRTGDRFAASLLRRRAMTIARTEAASAAIQGRKVGYQELFDSNFLDQSTATKSWIVDASGPCPICEANGEQGSIGYGDTFSSGDDAPPAHPNCECDIEMTADFGPLSLPDWASSAVAAGEL